MAIAKVNGVNLHYELHGQGEPLVLIAGYTCDKATWLPILDTLAKHYQVLVFDNRDSGQSDCPSESYSMEDFAHDAISLIEYLGLNPINLIGHSMGGAIAQIIAKEKPQLLKKLILITTLISMRQTSVFSAETTLQLRKANISPKLAISDVLPWLFSNAFLKDSSQVEQFINFAIRYPYPQSIESAERQLNALKKFDSSNWYKTISVPTLVIEGEEDLICPHDSKILATGIPNAKLYTFKNMGHMPIIEQPAMLIHILLEFLK